MKGQNIFRALIKVFRNPINSLKWVTKKIKQKYFWNYYYQKLREPKKIGTIEKTSQTLTLISKNLYSNGFNVIDYKINNNDYLEYMKNANYSQYPYYYLGGLAGNITEKSLEHFLAAELLQLNEGDIYIDIASAESPAAEIYHKLYGCQIYRQDLSYREGIHGNIIGGDASKLPLSDGFASKIALHCSFEHFEGDADIRFIKESSRILRPGGKLCIIPLYLHTEYAITTDPAVLPKSGLSFEPDAVLYCRKGWLNRHGRHYDIPHLTSRIRQNLNDLKLTIYHIINPKEVDKSCYINFVAIFNKPIM